MGDHFVLLVDHLLTESTLGAAIASRSQSPAGHTAAVSVQSEPRRPPQKMAVEDGRKAPELVECRICQDDDLESNMETPCSCRGSLKYAHRKCVQLWCNEKGDTVCEICLQRFKPGYTAPQLFHYGGSPMNFRDLALDEDFLGDHPAGELGDLQARSPGPGLMTMVATERGLLAVASGDFADANSRSVVFCRCVAMIFTVLLVLRHALPVMIAGGDEDHYSVAESTLLLLRIVGVLFPIFVMARTLAMLYRRHRRHQEEEEQAPPWMERESRTIQMAEPAPL
ncbi:unnamed protein product [Spirodela intermedia]|uniref:RING-CH-type domain-containing protein n=1 Tax=Spirodela intermedia TaxID=51605 RepID=A0A7I8J5C4_SPIIN|nr:unnamed protein product [Spirodela intermedia]CAA6665428.1 unnamed protein product [Spirodela intermedia]